ncbi:hypothetical protein IV203_028388 [Nitzschia inconspicua]|uniref:Uncharacterized protein n=1 Tax=Nitzschia inconspicua TaxID=303405 RepID=A0A9K3LPS1_9STRA|nr:hypothetical protein IV203_028388 [Nitzschia inconspicua]
MFARITSSSPLTIVVILLIVFSISSSSAAARFGAKMTVVDEASTNKEQDNDDDVDVDESFIIGRRRHLNSNGIPCSQAVSEGLLTPTQESFTNFPCGTFPFGSDNNLGCTYFPRFNEYECVTDGNIGKAPPVVAAARNAGFGNPQPCTADGYTLKGDVKTWWWLCVKA